MVNGPMIRPSVYAFKKTGVYVCEENETTLPQDKIAASQSAVDEYFRVLAAPFSNEPLSMGGL